MKGQGTSLDFNWFRPGNRGIRLQVTGVPGSNLHEHHGQFAAFSWFPGAGALDC